MQMIFDKLPPFPGSKGEHSGQPGLLESLKAIGEVVGLLEDLRDAVRENNTLLHTLNATLGAVKDGATGSGTAADAPAPIEGIPSTRNEVEGIARDG